MAADRGGEVLGTSLLLRMLEQGTGAEGYLGEHGSLERPAAINVLPVRMQHAAAHDAFRAEAQLLIRLPHPLIGKQESKSTMNPMTGAIGGRIEVGNTALTDASDQHGSLLVKKLGNERNVALAVEQVEAKPTAQALLSEEGAEGAANALRPLARVLEEYLSVLPSHTVFLFPSGKTKGALSERMLESRVKNDEASAKLAALRPHDVRHRFGDRMAASVPLHQLAHVMGHDSFDTTTLSLQDTPYDVQQAARTIAWT